MNPTQAIDETIVDEFALEYASQDTNPDMCSVSAEIDGDEVEKSLRALRYWQGRQNEIDEHAHAEIERVKLWKQTQLETVEKRIAYHEAVARAYIVARGTKTETLINGTIKRRAGRDRVEIANADELQSWAIEAGKFEEVFKVKTTTTPDKNAIMRVIKEAGELPLGVDLVVGDESFSVDV